MVCLILKITVLFIGIRLKLGRMIWELTSHTDLCLMLGLPSFGA
jgi:hypothetical protein